MQLNDLQTSAIRLIVLDTRLLIESSDTDTDSEVIDTVKSLGDIAKNIVEYNTISDLYVRGTMNKMNNLYWLRMFDGLMESILVDLYALWALSMTDKTVDTIKMPTQPQVRHLDTHCRDHIHRVISAENAAPMDTVNEIVRLAEKARDEADYQKESESYETKTLYYRIFNDLTRLVKERPLIIAEVDTWK